MSGDSAEEKKHTPTTTKLRQLRQKGQVAVASDFRGFLMAALGLAIIAGFIDFLHQGLKRSIGSIFVPANHDIALADALFQAITTPVSAFVIGLMVLMLCAGLVLAAIDTKGIVVSPKAFSDALQRLNPISNIKERFSLRAIVDFVRAIGLTVVFFVGATLIIMPLIGDLFNSPLCGMTCVTAVVTTIFQRLLIFLLILMLLAAAIDYIVAHFFFLKQNRMTDTELKRENKDNYGSPELKQRQREFRQEIMSGEPARSMKASLAIHGHEKIYLIAYDRNQDGPPVVADILSPSDMDAEVETLRRDGKRIVYNAETGNAFRQAQRGEEIPDEAFDLVAQALRNSGLA